MNRSIFHKFIIAIEHLQQFIHENINFLGTNLRKTEIFIHS